MGQRYARSPWSPIAQSDLQPQGDPETVVCLSKQGSLVGLRILGLAEDVMLGVREDMEGQPLSCAVTDELKIDTRDWKSNPRRLPERPPDYGDA